jgi:IS30 family transposase
LPTNSKEVEQVAVAQRPRKAYKRLKFEDRKKIEQLVAAGKTVDEMALIIGVHSATMYRELERGGEPYRAEVAQKSV